MYYWERPTHEPPAEALEATESLDALEARRSPGRDRADHGVRTDVYAPGYEPAVWIWAKGRWRFGVIRARHVYRDGAVRLHVDLAIGMDRFRRVYEWPQPGILPAHPGRRLTHRHSAS
jgi:hypothetical protein